MAETVGDTETILPGEVPEGEFQPVTVGKKFSLPAISAKSKSWELPAELAEFLQERCNSYLSDKELEEFLTTNTPTNVKGATKLDPFLKSLLDKKGLNRTISVDDEQQKIHQKLYQVMGPLSAAWATLQEVVNAEEEPTHDPEIVLKHLNDSIVLLGQVINKVAYERRLSILTALNDNKQAKKQLRDNQEEISKDSQFLFGEEFQKQIKTCAKAQESADKLLSRPGKRKFPTHTNRPNQAGSSTSNYSPRPSGGASSWSSRGRGGGSWKRGKKISVIHSNALKSVGSTEPKVGLPKPKRSFFKKNGDRDNSVSGQAKVFSRKLGTDNNRSDNTQNCKGQETPSDRQTSSMEGAKSDSYVRTGKSSSERGNSFNDTERCPDRGTICEGPIFFQKFL